MVVDLSFKGVCKFIKNDYPELIDDIDALLSLVLVSSVVFTGNPSLIMDAIVGGALANVFGVKSELSKIGKKIVEKITEKKDNDPLVRLQRMEAAYCLICYTAFFEAIDHQPVLSELRKKVKLTSEEKFQLSKSARYEEFYI